MDDLVIWPRDSRYCHAVLPWVLTHLDHYRVRCWLLETSWEEFTEWMIHENWHQPGGYQVAFNDLAKAVLFKLSMDPHPKGPRSA